METPQKRCTQCDGVYPATTEFFHLNKQQSDGLHCYCKPCRKLRSRNRYLANPEPILEYNRKRRALGLEADKETQRRWVERNREKTRRSARRSQKKHRARVTEYMRKWRAENADRYRAYDREYRAKMRDRVRANATRARRRDPLRFRAYNQNYHAFKQGHPGVSKEEIAAQYDKQQGQCYWCSVSVADTYHVDHLIPLSRQGIHSPDNIVIACPTCNVSKSDKLPFTEWIPPNPLKLHINFE